jgi:sec-independent protein translocase protein TatB
MSGVGFSELLILALIGLIVLGPEKLPRVASQIGNWVGQARRMTRVMRRQLEDELDFDEDLKPKSKPGGGTPRDDDTYSPAHVAESNALSDVADELATAPADKPEINGGEDDGGEDDGVEKAGVEKDSAAENCDEDDAKSQASAGDSPKSPDSEPEEKKP